MLKESLYAWTPLDSGSSHKLLSHLGLPSEPVGLAYWTTTPWTLWANQAFALSTQGSLALSRLADGCLALVSADRLSALASLQVCLGLHPIDTLTNTDLVALGIHAVSLLGERTVPVGLAAFAQDSEGTGFVHIAPAFGPDMSTPMGKDGRYRLDVGPQGG